LEALLQLDRLAQERAKTPLTLDSLTRGDREAELERWLDQQGVANAWEVAPTLVNLGYDGDQLNTLASQFEVSQLPAVTEWLNCTAIIHGVLDEIGQGAGRISEIVNALKAYTYLDQAPVQKVDVHAGLDNTLVILRGKLHEGITVHRDYAPDLPSVLAYGSELNQVWTNLIDNAIDAVNGSGEITLCTGHDDDWVIVAVEDNGHGIPQDIQGSIFDPFFTTKAPGNGTGMGLNISHSIVVQRHKGRIDLSSEPGKTRFEVRLPHQFVPEV
jgi:signal transduction histidine kinase